MSQGGSTKRNVPSSATALRLAVLAVLVGWALIQPPPVCALVVENMTGTTAAPAGAGNDPGWNFVTEHGSRSYVYLGDGWALSAFHVGVPTASEPISFPGGTFNVIPNQSYAVKNPVGSGLTELTDLRLIRIDGDLGTPTFNIASQQIFETTPLAQREVVFMGPGPSRQDYQAQWDVTVVAGPNNDVWTEVFPPETGTYKGYRSVLPDDDIKRWGKNRIADEDALFGGNDTDLRGTLQLSLSGGVRDIVSMVTQFDAPTAGGITNETQTVAGDSGTAVVFKRNGQWELTGIVNAVYSTYENQNNTLAVYGNYTTFADLSYYRNEIMSIINANPNYSVVGDVNLDGVVNGGTTGGVPTGDVAAFVAGWGYDNGTGVGDLESWQRGDLNRDGRTDALDFFLLRNALPVSGAGGRLSLDSLVGSGGVPEPASVLLSLLGAAFLALWRRPPR